MSYAVVVIGQTARSHRTEGMYERIIKGHASEHQHYGLCYGKDKIYGIKPLWPYPSSSERSCPAKGREPLKQQCSDRLCQEKALSAMANISIPIPPIQMSEGAPEEYSLRMYLHIGKYGGACGGKSRGMIQKKRVYRVRYAACDHKGNCAESS